MTKTNIDLGWDNISRMMLDTEASLQRLEGTRKEFTNSHSERMELVNGILNRIENIVIEPLEPIIVSKVEESNSSLDVTLDQISNDLDELLVSF